MNPGLRRIIIGIVAGLLFLALLVGLLQGGKAKREVDWKPSFSANSDRPFGSSLVYRRLLDLYHSDSLQLLPEGPFPELAYQDHEGQMLVIICNQFFPTDHRLEELKEFAYQGNDVWIAARYLSSSLMEELDLSTTYLNPSVGDSVFVEVKASGHGFSFPARHLKTRFNSWDRSRTIVMSEVNMDRAVCLRVQYGRGSFILASHPLIFTNYHLLRQEGAMYMEELFAYVSEERGLMWDEYYKPERPNQSSSSQDQNPRERDPSQSLWAYINQHEALSWTLYLLLGGALLYVLLGGKRRQRKVPIIEPLSNTTLEFTETIGRLYLFGGGKNAKGKNHRQIAEKKIRVWMGQIRSKYNLKTDVLGKEFEKALTAKTSCEEEEISALIGTIREVQQKNILTVNELLNLNEEIEQFYKKNGR